MMGAWPASALGESTPSRPHSSSGGSGGGCPGSSAAGCWRRPAGTARASWGRSSSRRGSA